MNLELKSLSVTSGQATGDEIIIATVSVDSLEEVLGDIEVYFIERTTGWKKQAKIERTISNTIHFYCPSYSDAKITSKVKVGVQLKRSSDGILSNILQFTYVPSLTNENIPVEEQMKMYSSLQNTSEKKKKTMKHCQYSPQDSADEGQTGCSELESSKSTNLQKKTLQKAEAINEPNRSDVRLSNNLRRVHSPETAGQNKFIKIQQERFCKSEDSGYDSLGTVCKGFESEIDCDESKTSMTIIEVLESEVETDCAIQCLSPCQRFLYTQDSVSSGYCSATSTLVSPVEYRKPICPPSKEDEVDSVVRNIPSVKVDSSGARLKIPNTGVQLIIPPMAIPEGEVTDIGLAVDSLDNYTKLPYKDLNKGCIAPIITCLPNGYRFQKPVLIVFPHCGKQEDCPLQLYTSNSEPDEAKDWKQVKHNQEDSSQILFLKNQYGYLFVNHFTDFVIITLPSGKYQAKYMRIVVYANELDDCQTFQEIHIHCHGDRDDLKKAIDEEEKKEDRRQMTHLLRFELYNCESSVTVNVKTGNGWIMQSEEEEQILNNLWRKDIGSCQYAFENVGDINEFHCQISVQQSGFDKAKLVVTNRVKNLDLPTAPLRGVNVLDDNRTGENQSQVQASRWLSSDIQQSQTRSTDSGHASASFRSQMSSTVVYNEGLSHSTGPNFSHPRIPPPNYTFPGQMSYPYGHPSIFSPQSPISCPLKVPYFLRIKLYEKLNPTMADGNDWRMFASVIDCENLVRLGETYPSPTECVLQAWESKDEPLEKLIEHLKACSRIDAANLVEDHIKKTNQNLNQLANPINNRNAICPTGNVSTRNNQLENTTRSHKSSPQDVTDGSIPNLDDSNGSDLVLNMSTSSSTSSFSSPEKEFKEPNFPHSSSDVFVDTNENMQDITRSVEDLTMEDKVNNI
ncbi:uncharacterized protein [Antedon mediterranea]|uniref:uncharacterized protein n=1 Tax=Antedon mediterranea TaxID=105859 RepID=UPI003AF80306